MTRAGLRRTAAALTLAAAAAAAAAGVAARGGDREPSALVEGRWSIAVRDHGRVVERYRFHNNLLGAATLNFARALAKVSPYSWTVSLAGNAPGGGGLCGSGSCVVSEASTGSTHLTATSSGSTIVLYGAYIAQKDGTIKQVTSLLNTGGTGISWGFSSRTGLNIPVVQGQQVQVTVNLTFQ